MIILAVVAVVVSLFGLAVYLHSKGVFNDRDGDYLPDFVEDTAEDLKIKAIAFVEEVRKRAKSTGKEASDVIAALKEVGNQIDDIPSAIAGKKRPGRKPKK